MAKRRVNKTAKIRDYLAEHPDSSAAEVAEALKAYKISASYVSNVKLKLKKNTQPRPAPRKARASSDKSILAAAEFINGCGGIDAAIEALDIAAEVVRRVR